MSRGMHCEAQKGEARHLEVVQERLSRGWPREVWETEVAEDESDCAVLRFAGGTVDLHAPLLRG